MGGVIHGMRYTRTYRVWQSMKSRCDDPNVHNYDLYGGRGIGYCSRWFNFTNFLEDMGEASDNMELDRKDNNLGYFKENCRWATKPQQMFNRGIFKRNTTGIKGVSWVQKDRCWQVCGQFNSIKYHLYYGPDFFEACCARRSWELKLKEQV